jgi:hypothetical protein
MFATERGDASIVEDQQIRFLPSFQELGESTIAHGFSQFPE